MSYLHLRLTSERLTSGGREAAKWLALLLMTGDHVNKVLLDGQVPLLTLAARVVFPIFSIILAYNVTVTPDAKAIDRSLLRLAVAGLIVQPLHAVALGYWLPLNVLFTLAAGLYVLAAPNLLGALIVATVAGAFVDYQWYGIALVVAAVTYFRAPTALNAVFVVVAVASLYFINGNFAALAALPILLALRDVQWHVPRWRWTFLGYYGCHLLLLAVLARYVFPAVG